MAEIDRINSSAMHSSLRLFGDEVLTDPADPDSATETGLAKDGATFQVGANAGEDNTIKADSSLFKSVKFSSMTGASNFNLVRLYEGNVEEADGTNDGKVKFGTNTYITTEPEILDADGDPLTKEGYFDLAIEALDAAIDDITHRKSIIGSAGNRMDSALSTLTTQEENLSSAKSIITDADIAKQASKFTQESILQQVSTSLLAQANQAPSVALSLVE